jgi:hypothetical protein
VEGVFGNGRKASVRGSPPKRRAHGTPEQELKLFTVASSRSEWTLAFLISLITANTTAGGVELRNVRLSDIDFKSKTLSVRVGKNRFRARIIPLNQTAMWAIERQKTKKSLVGTGRFELPTPRNPSDTEEEHSSISSSQNC